MQFIKVFSGKDIIDLNPFLIIKVEKLTEGMSFERAEKLGVKYNV